MALIEINARNNAFDCLNQSARLENDVAAAAKFERQLGAGRSPVRSANVFAMTFQLQSNP